MSKISKESEMQSEYDFSKGVRGKYYRSYQEVGAGLRKALTHTLPFTLRDFGQDQFADEFVATMNHAAEQAVPEATAIFGEAIQAMSMDDAATRSSVNIPKPH